MAFADKYPKSGKVTASTNNVPTAFSTGAGSLVLSGLQGKAYDHLMIINETSTQISVISDPSATTAPSASSTARVFVAANGTATFDKFPIFDAVYIQSEGSAISSGTVEVQVW